MLQKFHDLHFDEMKQGEKYIASRYSKYLQVSNIID